MPLFEQVDAATFQATEYTVGPWSREAQHGGAPAALMAHAMGSVGNPGMFTARFTAEFLRPVPIDQITATASVARSGGRVEIVTAALWARGEQVAAARALRIRRHPGLEVPTTASTSPPPIPEPADLGIPLDHVSFVTDALEVRFVEGSMVTPGPATAWIRLAVPVVDDRPVTPLQRTLAAADCGNGIAALADWRSLLFINPDLTAYLHREPTGEWVLMRSVTVLQPHGVGLAHSELSDEVGPLGRSLQSLYVDRL